MFLDLKYFYSVVHSYPFTQQWYHQRLVKTMEGRSLLAGLVYFWFLFIGVTFLSSLFFIIKYYSMHKLHLDFLNDYISQILFFCLIMFNSILL